MIYDIPSKEFVSEKHMTDEQFASVTVNISDRITPIVEDMFEQIIAIDRTKIAIAGGYALSLFNNDKNFTDIDIFVKSDVYTKVTDLLLANGYKHVAQDFVFPDSMYFARTIVMKFVKDESSFVDVVVYGEAQTHTDLDTDADSDSEGMEADADSDKPQKRILHHKQSIRNQSSFDEQYDTPSSLDDVVQHVMDSFDLSICRILYRGNGNFTLCDSVGTNVVENFEKKEFHVNAVDMQMHKVYSRILKYENKGYTFIPTDYFKFMLRAYVPAPMFMGYGDETRVEYDAWHTLVMRYRPDMMEIPYIEKFVALRDGFIGKSGKTSADLHEYMAADKAIFLEYLAKVAEQQDQVYADHVTDYTYTVPMCTYKSVIERNRKQFIDELNFDAETHVYFKDPNLATQQLAKLMLASLGPSASVKSELVAQATLLQKFMKSRKWSQHQCMEGYAELSPDEIDKIKREFYEVIRMSNNPLTRLLYDVI